MSEDSIKLTSPSTILESGLITLPADTNTTLSMLNSSLSRIQEQIKFADTKGGFFATLSLLLAGFVAQGAGRIANGMGGESHAIAFVALVLLCLYVVTTTISLTFILLAVMPRLVNRGEMTRTFFSHISEHYGVDHQRYCQDVRSMTAEHWAQELSAQIISISSIADRKHRLIRRAAMWSIASLALWFAVLVTMQFIHA